MIKTFFRGLNIVEFVTCAALATAVGFGFIPPYVESRENARVAGTRLEMRDTAIALGAFEADHGRFPPSGRAIAPAGIMGQSGFSPITTANTRFGDSRGARAQFTFRLPDPDGLPFATLTSPVAYLQNLPEDSFAHTRGARLGYYAPPSGNGWILFSVGPDRDENRPDGPGDIGPRVENLYDPGENPPGVWQVSVPLLNVTYDPSNGVFSNGDLWRVDGM